MARYTAASVLVGILALWWNYAYPPKDTTPGVSTEMHSYTVPMYFTVFYLVSLPTLKWLTENKLAPQYDMKLLLTECMVIYNLAQVLLNGWMVYAMVKAVLFGGHPFIGSRSLRGIAIESGASHAVWAHYCDKYLEFFDTYFMILRGKMEQVSFLHIYHHTTIAWAWWIALRYSPGGDIYFGALLNSFIHVLMYSYYALALMKVSCPWKHFLTQAQLLQFLSVVIYTTTTAYKHYRDLPHEAIDGEQPSLRTYLFCCAVQVFEMVSLFILFSLFYKKSYSNKKATAKRSNCSKDIDQCQKAMAEISTAAKEAAGHAAKLASASKVVKSRNNVMNTM